MRRGDFRKLSRDGSTVSDYSTLLKGVIARRDLSSEDVAAAIGAIMDGAWTPAQSAAFLAALAAKGETPGEVIGAAQAMRARSLVVSHDLPLVADVCGTGGDGAHTINISTCVGFVVAACGVPVAKHGNRAASSRCGSADVLEELGVPIELDPDVASRRLTTDGFVFLFAQRYHPAMKAVAPVRRELGVRTVFNVLGPLTNPACATHQVIGVPAESALELVGAALEGLGACAGAIVHATSGIDEVAGDVPTHVYAFGRGRARRYLIDPAEYGIAVPPEAIRGGVPHENARVMRAILRGEPHGARAVVALNAALALVVAEKADSIADGLDLATRALASGAANAVFETAKATEHAHG
jgi:anthranilate phosphoribosyltransferase